MLLRRLTVSFMTTLLIAALASAAAQSIPRQIRVQILEAVVQVIPYDIDAGEPAPWSGSGTIISPDGYILTNYHVIGDLDARTHYTWHAILVTDPAFTDQPPRFTYWAEYVASDPTHDLAILKIVEYADETPVPAGTVFPSVAVGDSNLLLPGDGIVIVGYPGISGATITFTSGTMSGWVGEDFETGGKQWIKTDAKIAHGNSGGAAFTLDGQLIGVPTAGRTIKYDELDVEEQAYVRPIGLAWAVIGPNVANVRRDAPTVSQPTTPTTPSTAPPTTTPNTPGNDAAMPSGEYGAIVIDAPRSARLAAASEDGFSYHGYTVAVPPGTSRIVIAVDGMGNDLDLAVSNGVPISAYDDVEHLDTSAEPNPQHVVVDPASTVYVDVLNLQARPSDYTLTVTTEGSSAGQPTQPATGNPLDLGNASAPTPAAPPTGSAPAITAPFRGSGIIGALAIGQIATGTIDGLDGGASYHTYFVDVPAGTTSLVVRLAADEDLDLAVKLGAEIDAYTSEGNWDYIDASTNTTAELVIPNPSGLLYIDVFNVLGPGINGTYTLEVR